MTRKQKQIISEELETLRNSCLEGLDETWDCSTKEGREGFQPMADSCEKIAAILGIDLLASGSTPL